MRTAYVLTEHYEGNEDTISLTSVLFAPSPMWAAYKLEYLNKGSMH